MSRKLFALVLVLMMAFAVSAYAATATEGPPTPPAPAAPAAPPAPAAPKPDRCEAVFMSNGDEYGCTAIAALDLMMPGIVNNQLDAKKKVVKTGVRTVVNAMTDEAFKAYNKAFEAKVRRYVWENADYIIGDPDKMFMEGYRLEAPAIRKFLEKNPTWMDLIAVGGRWNIPHGGHKAAAPAKPATEGTPLGAPPPPAEENK